VEDYGRLPSAPFRHVVTAQRAGVLTGLDAERVGRASVALGAGRDRADDAVDPAVGIMVLAAPGDRVGAGDPVLELHYRDRSRLDAALPLVTGALTIGDTPPVPKSLILAEVR
jgi:thymidine phosphorylase